MYSVPARLLIFSPPISSQPQWIQWRTNGTPVTDSLCAISHSWCGNLLSGPPVWMSSVSPRYLRDIAEHSMCQPGKPSPHGESHLTSRSGPAAFQSVKSAWWRLRGSTSSWRWPALSWSRLLRDSRPYEGKLSTA